MSDSSISQRDAFISYASEDRNTVAKPLAEILIALGISVWFDQFDLKIGDSLRRKIDEGLSKSRYGIVILSSSFFGKHYPNLELDGLAQRESGGEKIILPIWVGVNKEQVQQFSLSLSDRIAGRWEDGISKVVMKLIEVIKPEAMEALLKRQIIVLPRLSSGKEVLNVITGSHFSYSYNDEPNDEAEIDLVGGFIQNLRDWSDIWDDIDVPGQMRAAVQITDMIKEIEAAGWTVHGAKMKGKRKLAGVASEWTWYAIAVLRGESGEREVMFVDDRIIVLNPEQNT